jgi:hypothetical protein
MKTETQLLLTSKLALVSDVPGWANPLLRFLTQIWIAK